MEDETTTVAAAQDTGVEQTQPVVSDDTAAVQDTTATTDTTDDQASATTHDEPSDDDQLNEWAQGKGLELDSDNARKAAKMAREAEKAMHQKAQKASELEKTIATSSDAIAEEVATTTGQDPELLKRLQRVEVRENVRDFWNQEGIDKSYESKMIEILQEKPHLAGDLESLYATAVMKSGGAAKSQAKREALESLAHKQQAAVPTGHATTPGVTPKDKPFEELSIKEMESKLGFVRQ